MRQTNSRRTAVAGVLASAVLAALLMIPASRQLGTTEGLWLAAATLGVPTIAVLVATSFQYYGLLRSLAIGTVIAGITCVVSLVVAAFVFATALSGSVTGFLLAIVLFGVPALTVAIVGLLAMRLAPSEPSTVSEHESVS